jgi:F-type H+-transporting ATPase subunit b
MEELVKTFHVELNLLLAQIVNFAIVLIVLYKFAYKPILKTLNDRTKKIEKGLKNSEEASKKLEEITEKEKDVLMKAKKQAQEIIKIAQDSATREAAAISVEAQSQNRKMLDDAKIQLEREKGKIVSEVKSEIAGLVILAVEKIISEKLDSTKDKELIEKAIK